MVIGIGAGSIGTTSTEYCPNPSAASIEALFAPCQTFDSAMGHAVSKQKPNRWACCCRRAANLAGYLISRNILRDLQAGRFSFGEFYVRRTRRIYPALIFTVVITYLCGALWCAPVMFLDLAKESTHALLSISNIQYWREPHQYFAPNSDELALLHCWSLSLEEQFYLFWPVFLFLASKWGRAFQVITAAAIASFLLSIVTAKVDPLAVFFLMPFRIFEFSIGALVLLLEKRISLGKVAAESLSVAGLLGVVASVLLFRSDRRRAD